MSRKVHCRNIKDIKSMYEYDDDLIRKDMMRIADAKSVGFYTYFSAILQAQYMMTCSDKRVTGEEYENWIKSLKEFFDQADDVERNIVYKKLAMLHFRYEYEIQQVGKYDVQELVAKLGMNRDEYYHHYRHPHMREKMVRDFVSAGFDPITIIRKKTEVMLTIMEDTTAARKDRIAAGKELTKYIDYKVMPDKKNVVFGNNVMVDESTNKQINSGNTNMIDFSALPGMDDAGVRKELSNGKMGEYGDREDEDEVIEGEFEDFNKGEDR
jgi:hypothetical protein